MSGICAGGRLWTTPRERVRWQAIWLLAQGWDGLRDSGGSGKGPPYHWPEGWGLWLGWTRGFDFRADLRFPRPWGGAAGGVERGGTTAAVSIRHGNGQLVFEGGSAVRPGTVWNRFEPEQLPELPPSTRGQALHRLGFAFKRPIRRLVKANEARREVFVGKYGDLWEEAERTGAEIFFADEAHFQADAELRGKWVLKGNPH